MKAFVTGSRAYGTPTPDSDIDLVVYVSHDDMNLLNRAAGLQERRTEIGDYGSHAHSVQLKFGDLNLLCVTSVESYAAWLAGTVALKKERPVTRARAVELLSEFRKRLGVTPNEKETGR